MIFKTLIVPLLLIVSMIVLVNSCGTKAIEEQNYHPDFWVGNPYDLSIVNERDQKIFCEDENFINYGCLHIEKIIELKNELQKRCK